MQRLMKGARMESDPEIVLWENEAKKNGLDIRENMYIYFVVFEFRICVSLLQAVLSASAFVEVCHDLLRFNFHWRQSAYSIGGT